MNEDKTDYIFKTKITDNCINCKKCVKQCIMLEKYVQNPKNFFISCSDIEKINPIIPYSCMVCHTCALVCPKELDLGKAFLELRYILVDKNNGKLPLNQLTGVKIHQFLSFSKFFSTIRKG